MNLVDGTRRSVLVEVRALIEQCRQVLAPADVQLFEDPLEVAVDRSDRHDEPYRHLAVGQPLGDKQGDVTLEHRERYGALREVEGRGMDGPLAEQGSGPVGCGEDADGSPIAVVSSGRLGGRLSGEQ